MCFQEQRLPLVQKLTVAPIQHNVLTVMMCIRWVVLFLRVCAHKMHLEWNSCSTLFRTWQFKVVHLLKSSLATQVGLNLSVKGLMGLMFSAPLQLTRRSPTNGADLVNLRKHDSAWYNDAIHEGIHSAAGCERGFSRPWFQWANRCDANGRSNALISRETIAVLGVTISKKASQRCGKSQDSLIAKRLVI
jgi:hypothetical protein